ncbi:ABC transporter permease [Jeotgalicoccus meleagridis]|uniref:Glycine betaine/carnitine/choline transport system permease protein OpuCB n=1 Tax=Jeotgalicoccus meleagridis TaxID=2759181 RepID=A0A6V7R8W8_9STAP|nr:ABC transporter permease [Jeotgalicoccus meleagridis]CAD2073937.1 Glycine betaine/carnitine/choline transport system permease protein OpuCB [Jeotgalicoccus meleagridis]
MMDFISSNGTDLLYKTWEHLYISIISLGIGIIIAVPVGMAIANTKRLAGWILTLAGVLQTVPTLAVLALMIPLFGIGRVPAIIALSAYILLPILNNTIIGVRNIDPDLRDAAKSMGMTKGQVIKSLEIPLATPLILSGVRLSSVYVISWATLASYIGAGGLGDYIFNGLNTYQPELIISATVMVTVIALLADYCLALAEKWITPKGLKVSR